MIIFAPVLTWAAADAAQNNPANEGLRDVHGPVNYPSSYYAVFMILLIIALSALVQFLRKRNAGKIVKIEMPVDNRSPWEIACERFDELQRKSLLESGHYKEFYSCLSDIVRHYFELQFTIRAPEMTTEEFLRSLEGSRELSSSQKEALKKFLNSCDIVKFAKYIPGIDEGRASFKLARELVDETRPPALEDQALTTPKR